LEKRHLAGDVGSTGAKMVEYPALRGMLRVAAAGACNLDEREEKLGLRGWGGGNAGKYQGKEGGAEARKLEKGTEKSKWKIQSETE